VSREHACIEWREVAWFVTDLGSKRGTRLSGEPLAPNEPVILRNRDALQFGTCLFEVTVDDAEQAQRPKGETQYRTRASIFLRLHDDQTVVRELSWEEFRGRYAPVIVGFARNMGLHTQDADDVLQDVLLAFFQVSSRFEYDPAKGRFRGYLKLITRRTIAESARRAGRAGVPSEDLDRDEMPEPDELWDRIWDEQLFERALEEARQKFEPRTMEAFELFARRNVPAEEVAQRLGMSVNSVHHAKSRVMKEVQQIVDRFSADEG
jgi:RNA polymerase sigma-70 factor (ECF subfamily)